MVARLSERVFFLLKASLSDLLELGSVAGTPEKHEDLLSELKHELGRLIAHRYALVKLRGEADGSLETLDKKAAIAVEKDRDDLARAALEQKSALKAERDDQHANIDVLDIQIDKISRLITTLEDETSSPENLSTKLKELDALVAEFEANTKRETS